MMLARPTTIPPARGLLPLALLLVGWQLGNPSSPYLPPPSTWAQALGDLWSGGALLPAVAATLLTFALALGAAIVLGIGLGLLVGGVRRADRAFGPSLEFARAMPPAAVVPIATLLLGYSQQMKVVVVASGAIWPILLSTRAAVRRLDPVLLETARSLHLTRWQQLRKVTLPALAPGMFLGVRLGAPIALVVTLLVEFLTQVDGVGGLIATAQRSYLSAEVWGLILLAGLFSVSFNSVVATVEGRMFRSRTGSARRRRGRAAR